MSRISHCVMVTVCVALGTTYGAEAAKRPDSAVKKSSTPTVTKNVPEPRPSPAAVAPTTSSAVAHPQETPSAAKTNEASAERMGTRWHKRIVHRVKHCPAADVAKTLAEFYKSDGGLVIVPDPLSNCLLISAVPGALEEVVRTVEELDRPPAVVSIEVLIAEVKLKAAETADKQSGAAPAISGESVDAQLRALQKRGDVDVLCRPRLMTISNQAAFIHIGSREPTTVGSSVTQAGRQSTVTLENVGLIVGVTPRVCGDGLITMQIDVEKSEVGPQQEGMPVAESPGVQPMRRPRITTLTAQSTLCVPDGQTAVLGGLVSESTSRRTEMIILVVPRIVDAKPKAEKPK